jgi:hypothetical protein
VPRGGLVKSSFETRNRPALAIYDFPVRAGPSAFVADWLLWAAEPSPPLKDTFLRPAGFPEVERTLSYLRDCLSWILQKCAILSSRSVVHRLACLPAV